MSKSYKEQRPLLYDDLSDDDFNAQDYNRLQQNTQMRPVINSGRAKNQMKGAAAILSNWPGHWWSTLKYWWMGLGMIAIIVLIIYNSVVALSMFPITYTKAIKPRTSNSIVSVSSAQSSIFNIYMHIFTKTVDQVNFDEFLPYVEIISNKNHQFKFNVIVVLTEKSELMNDMNDETQNYLALNSLWTDKSFAKDHNIKHANIAISYISLDKYLDVSPLHKFWRNFSQEFIEFLVRSLSIWEQGGIAFNPIILTPSSPNPFYMEKIQNLLNSYKKLKNNKNTEINEIVRHTKQSHKPKKKLNNIRDIIEALEMESNSDNNSQYNLTEAENNNYSVTVNVANERKFLPNENFSDPHNLHQSEILLISNKKETKPLVISDCSVRKAYDTHQLLTETNISNSGNIALNSNSSDNKTKPSLLPLFLEYLFPKKPEIISVEMNGRQGTKESNKIKSLNNPANSKLHEKSNDNFFTSNDEKNKQDLFSHYETEKGLHEYETDTQLTIDLKGYIIASNKACHAFVGNLLSAVHHAEGEILTNFIITELTTFCKGDMSSCKGVDVI